MRLAHFIGSFEKDASWIRAMFEKGRELKREIGAENVADLSLGNPLHTPHPKVLEELSRMVADPLHHAYTPNLGLDETREAIASFLKTRSGIPFEKRHVAVVAGAAGGLVVALRALMDTGETLGVFSPYFTEYPFYAKALGFEFVAQPLSPPFIPDLEATRSLLAKKPRVILINSPNNPTGQVWDGDAYGAISKALGELDPKDRPSILIDDPYAGLVYDGLNPPFGLAELPQALYVSSFSKVWAIPGSRLGFLAIHPDNPLAYEIMEAIGFLVRALGFVNANAPAQHMLARLGLEGFNPDLKPYQENRDFLVAELKSLGLSFGTPKGGFYVFPKVPESFKDDLAFVSRALLDGLILVPGRGFGHRDRFRMVFSVTRKTLELAMDKLHKVLTNPSRSV